MTGAIAKMHGKKLAVIGAGKAAIPILNKAKMLGVDTYCFGLKKGSIAKSLATYFFPISIFDIEAILDVCKLQKINGVLATSDITTPITAELADSLALPGNRTEGGFAGNNKLWMRQRVACLEDISQPKFWCYSPGMSTEYPVVVKAPDSSGKKGITYVADEAHLDQAIRYAGQYSTDGNILIENYLGDGIEYSVECLVCKGDVFVIQITEKESGGPPHFLELAHHQPANLSFSRNSAIVSTVTKILEAVGIENGMAHVEVKLQGDNVYFIELGARAAGGYVADTLIGLSTNYDYFSGAIQIALNCFEPPRVENVACSGIYFLCRQTAHLMPLFESAVNADWCVSLKFPKNIHKEIRDTDERDIEAGHLIYRAENKITL